MLTLVTTAEAAAESAEAEAAAESAEAEATAESAEAEAGRGERGESGRSERGEAGRGQRGARGEAGRGEAGRDERGEAGRDERGEAGREAARGFDAAYSLVTRLTWPCSDLAEIPESRAGERTCFNFEGRSRLLATGTSSMAERRSGPV